MMLFLLLVSIVFAWWGIYQLKTGKMVAKNLKYPVDEPREVGLFFLGISIAFLIPTLRLGAGYLLLSGHLPESAVDIVDISCIVAFALLLLVAIFFSTKSLFSRRIFGLKSDKILDKLVKKFYLPVDLFAIIFYVFLGISIIGNAFFSLGIFAGLLGLLSILAFFVYAILMATISLKYEKLAKSQKPPKKSQKSPKKHL